MRYVQWAFLVNPGWAGLPPAILGPNILSKRVEIGSIAILFGLVYVQIIPRLPGACL